MNPLNFLENIAAETRRRVALRKIRVPETMLREALPDAPARPSFAGALAQPGIRIIAELKKASPSKGLIREAFDVSELAAELESAGAAALSVLTEETYFGGSPENLRIAARAVRLPLLCKDFIVDSYQLIEAKHNGASAALLIAALLDDAAFRALVRTARALGLEVLAEAHTPAELDRVLASGVRIVGINARDLRTFDCSLDRAEALLRQIPPDRIAVAESAVGSAADRRRLADAGARAFLVGEALMRAPSPGDRLREILQ